MTVSGVLAAFTGNRRWLLVGLGLYALSWVMLGLGICLAGQATAERIRRHWRSRLRVHPKPPAATARTE